MGLKSYCALLLLVVILSTCLVNWGQCYMIGNNPYHRADYLDTQGMYYMEWEVDHQRKVILFSITAQTTGYVLFGLANNGSANTGADIVIGGVRSNGQTYFFDRYTLGGNNVPRQDTSKQDDYVFLGAWENSTHTTISFWRLFDTCDSQDYPISDNSVTVLWGFGETDDYETVRNYGVRGSKDHYLLNPDYAPRITRDGSSSGPPTVVTRDNLQVWTIQTQVLLPNNGTSYICTMHKAPRLQRKHHMVGYDVYFPNERSRQRAHHFLIYKCNAPGRGDPRPLFDRFLGQQGETCFIPTRFPSAGFLPTYLCTELWTGWALGGREFFTPPSAGYPFGLGQDEYYMLQVHWDNPERRLGMIVDIRIDMFYTSFLRAQDAGMMGVGLENPALPPTILLPPGTTDDRVFSHCVAECTRRMFPQSGIRIFAAMLHSHYSGKRMRLRHFRGDQELPWILYDDNYANTFQHIRNLKDEVRVLQGDHISTECMYDNTWQNSSVVAGFTTQQEMCISFIFYYNRVSDYSYCRSEIVSQAYRQRFLGVSNVTWDENRIEWVAVTPPNLAGLTMTEISNNYVFWDAGKRQELKRFHEVYPHASRCSRDLAYRDQAQVQAFITAGFVNLPGNPVTELNTTDSYAGPGEYPFRARPYVSEQTCSYNG